MTHVKSNMDGYAQEVQAFVKLIAEMESFTLQKHVMTEMKLTIWVALVIAQGR